MCKITQDSSLFLHNRYSGNMCRNRVDVEEMSLILQSMLVNMSFFMQSAGCGNTHSARWKLEKSKAHAFELIGQFCMFVCIKC